VPITRDTNFKTTNKTQNIVIGILKIGSPLSTFIDGIARIYAAEKTAFHHKWGIPKTASLKMDF
jgi:hypothetical protein